MSLKIYAVSITDCIRIKLTLNLCSGTFSRSMHHRYMFLPAETGYKLPLINTHKIKWSHSLVSNVMLWNAFGTPNTSEVRSIFVDNQKFVAHNQKFVVENQTFVLSIRITKLQLQ